MWEKLKVGGKSFPRLINIEKWTNKATFLGPVSLYRVGFNAYIILSKDQIFSNLTNWLALYITNRTKLSKCLRRQHIWFNVIF